MRTRRHDNLEGKLGSFFFFAFGGRVLTDAHSVIRAQNALVVIPSRADGEGSLLDRQSHYHWEILRRRRDSG
jgi:hypothetical protein